MTSLLPSVAVAALLALTKVVMLDKDDPKPPFATVEAGPGSSAVGGVRLGFRTGARAGVLRGWTTPARPAV